MSGSRPASDTAPGGAARPLQTWLASVTARWERPVLFGLRMWASAAFALFVAFWLQLGEPGWAATTAMVACQPQVGASVRRGWFRIVGTLVGASMSMVVAMAFPQDRIGFLVCLVLWAGCASFASSLLRNFASYAAALSGYSVAIIGGGALGGTGGIRPDTLFELGVSRTSEIMLGIVCAGVLRTLTDVGDAPQRLASALAGLGSEMMRRFTETLSPPPGKRTDMQAVRREILRKAIALDPVIDQAIGESSHFRYNSPVLQRAADGLFCSLAAWRAVDTHLEMLPEDSRAEAGRLREYLPQDEALQQDLGDPRFWLAYPRGLREACRDTIDRMIGLVARSPSTRLLADKTAEFLAGMVHLLDGLVLLTEPGRPEQPRGSRSLRIADYLPALVNGVRTMSAVAAASLGWVATGWTNGVEMVTFSMVMSVLLGPRDAQAYAAALYFTGGVLLAAVGSTVIHFAVMPLFPTSYAALALIMAIYIVPVGAFAQAARKPWMAAMASTATIMFSPLLSPTNPMTYKAAASFNNIAAIVAGCMIAISAIRIIPPAPPRLMVVRLLRRTRSDLRRLAGGRPRNDWHGHILARLTAMPAAAAPVERAQLMVAFSVGQEIVQLRELAGPLGIAGPLEEAFDALRRGDCPGTAERMHRLDQLLAGREQTQTVLRARAGLFVIAEALRRHPSFFGEDPTP